MKSRILVGVLVLPMALLVGSLPSRAAESQPTAIVEALHDSLLEAMKRAQELGYEGRAELLAPALDRSFDLAFMARKTLGRHWKKLVDPDQERWRLAFRELTIANYAGRFDGFSGQRFETLGEEPAAHETMVVRTVLVLPDDDDVNLNYRLMQTPEGWRIVDVYLNGTVSELALRRSEYSSVLKREGFPALIASCQEKTRHLAAGQAD